MRTLIASAALGLCLTACGNQSKDQTPAAEQAPEAKAELSPAEAQNVEENFAEVPELAIVRVALDADGNVDESVAPELRTAIEADESSIEGVFAAADAPEKMISSDSELDADSSTQSWRRWGRGHYGHNYWRGNYRPAVYYRGFNYGYNYRSFYRSGGYGYYCYGRYRSW